MTQPTETMDTHVLSRTAAHLAERYAGIFSPETVERYVFESYATLSRTARVRTYLAATAGHFADDRLRALAQSQGKIDKPVAQVLFVCVHNIGRSQIAAALLAHHAGNRVEVRSAGSLPGAEVHPLVVEVLAERGIDLTGAFPKPLTDDVVRAADYVITMGCGDACPVSPGKRYLDWGIADPSQETLEGVREIVEAIDTRVQALWDQIRN
ncbi:arsenate-mycothiol transferase ArsC [Kocuria marina]|uniref:arsenate-mycothiol transferase ArsC n=1 Tax=Kocuria marina TaxID=223184 RepID=UPI0019D186EA|nr:arsenate reductase ArsC [Kocuria indica]MBN6812798.1 arsenate reductase ArsC [Kocuria indica]MBN6844491.1 arsenate reductase ArsC [Kocuria indica]